MSIRRKHYLNLFCSKDKRERERKAIIPDHEKVNLKMLANYESI